MKRSSKVVVVLLCATIVSIVTATHVGADNAPLYESPEGLAPGSPSTTTVQMVDEQVNVTVVERGSAAVALVSATFDMQNRGPTAEVLTGFPNYYYPQSFNPADSVPCCGRMFTPANITNFRAWTDSTTYTPMNQDVNMGTSTEQWFVWRAAYPSGRVLPVHVQYEQKLGDQSAYDGGVNEYANVIYVLQTGALWSGPIEHARITFEAASGGVFLGAAGATVADDQHIVWEFANFKPSADVGTAYVFATPWKHLQDAEAALNLPDAGPSDYLRAAQNAILLLKTSRQAALVPKGIVDRYGDRLQQWVANASVLDTADSWKAEGDAALFASGAVSHNGFLACWPDEAVAAYQQAVDRGSDAAAAQLADLQIAGQFLQQDPNADSASCGHA